MARYGVSITKNTSFRGFPQEFSNVYYYGHPTGTLDNAGALAMIDAVKALEVGCHSSAVTFVRGRCWSTGGTEASNQMIGQKNLSGVGSTATLSAFDKERAYLVRLYAGSDIRGNPVYLRKWFHSCGNGPGNVQPATAVLEQTAQFTAGNKTAIEAAVNSFGAVVIGGNGYELMAQSGREAIGTSFQSHNWLEHRQLGDQWRAT
jgi:hypothetical protein